ncbi:rod shape-determining protein MreD [Anaerocolumna sp. AGMB13025]|uniref:rod shape-determining protein MreD n=1 Tax=Anaerocolumna sp. AGMB13025 TaxID=3039116 RepID=UPI0024201631|nr:rod shape-determining protein MreD [Anaerocolumna sp. AGMB13025]WFR54757.1 rod shape-determining protein MreD [Anaerocolumna sp. AGMB13025]
MKRFIVLVIEILICFLLQTTVFQWIALAHVTPNLLLILTVATGLMRGRTEGLAVGFASGLLIDFCYGNVLGLFALIYMIIGYLNGYSHRIFVKDDLTIPILLVGVSQFVYFFLYYVFEFLLKGKLNILFYLVRIGLPGIIYTVVVSIVLYKLLNIINIRLDRKVEEEVT